MTSNPAVPGRVFAHTIDGRAVDSDTAFDVINPATGEAFAQAPDASKAQLDQAVQAARRAFADWSTHSFDARGLALSFFASKKYAEAIPPLEQAELPALLAAAWRATRPAST